MKFIRFTSQLARRKISTHGKQQRRNPAFYDVIYCGLSL